jgi:hypothetical protein
LPVTERESTTGPVENTNWIDAHKNKYWMGFSNASEDPLHKLDVNGHAWDFYYLQPITKNFNLTLRVYRA